MKHLFSILTALFAVLAFLVSCSGGSNGSNGSGGSGNDTTGSSGGIYGHVTDFATGEDVANANVQLRPGGDTTLTGSDGMFEFQNLASGDYLITVSKAGYTDLIDDFVITVRDRMVRRDVQLKKESATLRIVDDAGNDIDVLDFGAEIDDVSRQFNIFNDGSEKLEWEISFSVDWIKSVSKESGELKAGGTQGIIVNIDRTLLRDGENLTKLHITSDNGNKQLGIKATNSIRRSDCQDLPENAVWNKVGEIEQNWNGSEWFPSEKGSYNEEASETECRFKCNSGYFYDNKKCVDIDECAEQELNKCPTHSDCANEDGSFSCVCHEGYSGNNCVPNKRTRECEELPENAAWNKVSEIEQTWNGSEWYPPVKGTYNEEASETECRFKCNSGYVFEDKKCINQKTSKCTGLLENSHWNTASQIEQNWNGHEWIPPIEGSYNENPSETECRFVCDTNYKWKGSSCEANSKTTACTGLPANAIWNAASSITQTWNGTEWLPSAAGTYNEEETMSECHFKCKPNYTWKGATCEANVQTAECEGLPENASWNKVSSITQTWNGTEWLPSATGSFNEEESIGECRFKCNDNYHWENNQCLPNSKTEYCTSKPANTVWNDNGANGKFTQTWNGSEWEPETYSSSYNTVAGICRYKCNTNYNWNSSNSKCVAATQTYTCTGLPANAVWNSVSSYTQTWTGEEWTPSATAATYNTTASNTECRFKCDTNYSWENSQCVADTRTANCTGLLANTIWNTVSSITQTWNGSSWLPVTTGSYNTTASSAECRFKCKTNYTWDGSKCEANTRTASCTDIPANASWNSVSAIIQTWNGEDWTPSNTSTYNTTSSTSECRYKCADSYHTENGGASCISNTKTASCTGLITNATWNSVSSITQTWNGSTWVPTTTGTYNEESSSSECRYKCDNTHYWYNSQCTSPCDYEPCDEVANSTAVCNATSWRDYSCECDNRYYWSYPQCKQQKALGNICTGVTVCHNGGNYGQTMTCPTSPSADFYGQDAQYAAKGKCIPVTLSVETISDQNVVIDHNTGLEWQQEISSGNYSWEEAVNYCNNLNYGGHDSGWRLPTPQELLTIYVALDDPNYFTEISHMSLWSSKTSVSDPEYAWILGENSITTAFDFVSTLSKTLDDRVKVRCVWGKDLLSLSSFTTTTVNSNIVLTDSTTGLMWQKDYVSGKTWKEALSYCENLTYAGYSDWRLPNRNELASLINYDNVSPASDFPDMPSLEFWSSSVHHIVHFGTGIFVATPLMVSNTYPMKEMQRNVRCVRTAE